MLYMVLDLVVFVNSSTGFEVPGTNPTFDITFLLYAVQVAITSMIDRFSVVCDAFIMMPNSCLESVNIIIARSIPKNSMSFRLVRMNTSRDNLSLACK